MSTLNKIGKEAVVKHHEEVLFRLLESALELSCDPSYVTDKRWGWVEEALK